MNDPTPPNDPDEPTAPPSPPDPAENPLAEAEPPLHRQPWIRFAVAFSVIVTTLELLYHGIALESMAFYTFLSGLAQATGFVLEPFYERVSVTGARVSTNQFVVTVDYGCDGLQVCTLLTSAVLAFPSTWKQKFIGIVAGNLWLQCWNVLRIVTLVVIGGIERSWFHPTHVYIWPTILIALCLATWMTWARWTMPDDDGDPELQPAA